MSTPVIAFTRQTRLLTDLQVTDYVTAQQIQVTRDFGPRWGADARCVFVPYGGVIPEGAWRVIFNDHSAMNGALGYHDDNGLPTAYVSVADALANGTAWTVTGSHETLEMLGDPDIRKTATVIEDGVTHEYAYEACDACEDDALGYRINGHLLSDFVLPAWFDPAAVGPYTFRGTIDRPLALAAGGYIGVRELAPAPGAWTQRMAREVGPRQLKGPASRTMRRFAGTSA